MRLEELLVLTVEFVERDELFVTVLALEEERPDAAASPPLNEVLRPVVFVTELLRLEDSIVELRPFSADDEA